MEVNRDEAERCIDIATAALTDEQPEKAQRFLEKRRGCSRPRRPGVSQNGRAGVKGIRGGAGEGGRRGVHRSSSSIITCSITCIVPDEPGPRVDPPPAAVPWCTQQMGC
ncbi:unnamed protein product [Pleuronectes platessa]|uniref:Uncharacterized protein n=1 Tax=Pleuronectes platessa TaxID=8262 RepID=A0A9N7TPH5_PLEPL|nr:unnamed protein product [Pleuronectes platessa]